MLNPNKNNSLHEIELISSCKEVGYINCQSIFAFGANVLTS